MYPLLLVVFATRLGHLQAQFLPQFTSVPTTDETICPCQSHPITGPPQLDLFDRKSPEDVEFHLYTRSNKGGPSNSLILNDRNSLKDSGFKARKPVKFITHGYLEGTHRNEWMLTMKDAILDEEDVNVILVYWTRLAGNGNYVVSARNSLFVGKTIADLLHFIRNVRKNFSGSQVHLIGFSMGAQASGVAGHHFPGIARITGLDPAGPSYECVDHRDRLDASDAEFVDVVHTNAGCFVAGHIGNRAQLGHVDFYVNGGSDQPGCENILLDLARDVLNDYKFDICSHDRAFDYYTESIRLKKASHGYLCQNLQAFKSGSCFNNVRARFGYKAQKKTDNGTFFFETFAKSPYLGKHVTILTRISNERSSIFAGNLQFQALVPAMETPVSTVTGDLQTLNPGNEYITSTLVPFGTSLDDVQFAVAPQRSLVPSLISSLIAESISLIDNSSGNTYCFGSNIVLATPQIYTLKPVKGSC